MSTNGYRLRLEQNAERGVITIRGPLLLPDDSLLVDGHPVDGVLLTQDSDLVWGVWEDLRGFTPGSITVNVGAMPTNQGHAIVISVSNQATRPARTEHGVPINEASDSSYVNFDGHYRWIKARLVLNPTGEFTANLTGVDLYAG